MAAIEISKSAEKYLEELLQKQDSDTVGIKVFVSEPGSPRAETCIAYCKEDDDLTEYELFGDYSFSLYQEIKSLTFLENSVVDYSPDKFGGGCQGCGMVDVTLKDGIEKTLIEEIPELKGIADVTDHSYRENAYYK